MPYLLHRDPKSCEMCGPLTPPFVVTLFSRPWARDKGGMNTQIQHLRSRISERWSVARAPPSAHACMQAQAANVLPAPCRRRLPWASPTTCRSSTWYDGSGSWFLFVRERGGEKYVLAGARAHAGGEQRAAPSCDSGCRHRHVVTDTPRFGLGGRLTRQRGGH